MAVLPFLYPGSAATMVTPPGSVFIAGRVMSYLFSQTFTYS